MIHIRIVGADASAALAKAQRKLDEVRPLASAFGAFATSRSDTNLVGASQGALRGHSPVGE